MATQYPCLENPMDREAWRATVCGVAKESDMTEHACTATVTAVTLTSNSLPAICCENFPFIISSFHLHKPICIFTCLQIFKFLKLCLLLYFRKKWENKKPNPLCCYGKT